MYAVKKSDKSVFVNEDLLKSQTFASGAGLRPPSRAFGIRIMPSANVDATLLEDDMSVGRVEAKTRIKKMLESYKESCIAEMNAKIKEFTEKCEEETKGMIGEATVEAQSIWSKIVDLEKSKAEQAKMEEEEEKNKREKEKQEEEARKKVEDEKRVVEDKLDDKEKEEGNVKVEEKEREKSEEKEKSATNPARDTESPLVSGWKFSRNKSGDPAKTQLVGSRGKKAEREGMRFKPSSFGETLWALDEEDTSHGREDSLGSSSGFAGVKVSDDGSEDSVTLNDSATGLLPSTKRLLRKEEGEEEEDENVEKDNNSGKMAMAHSVPVAIPSGWGSNRRRALNSSDGGQEEERESGGSFERPDIIAANTWQEQVREEWIQKSQKQLKKKTAATVEEDNDDLEFLVATHSKLPEKRKAGNNL